MSDIRKQYFCCQLPRFCVLNHLNAKFIVCHLKIVILVSKTITMKVGGMRQMQNSVCGFYIKLSVKGKSGEIFILILIELNSC